MAKGTMLDVRKQGFEPTVCIVRNKRQNYLGKSLGNCRVLYIPKFTRISNQVCHYHQKTEEFISLRLLACLPFFPLIFLLLGEIYEIYIYIYFNFGN